MKEINLEELKNPITPLKWRVQSVTKDKKWCIMVPYVDARQVQDRLDVVCGPGGWQNTYDPETGASSIGILIDGDWVWKSDVGVESNTEAIKGRASDAIKRAGVVWGIARDVYNMGTKLLPATEKNGKFYPSTKDGKKILYTGDQQSAYLNGINESLGLLMQVHDNNSKLHSNEEYQKAMKAVFALIKANK